MKNLKRNNKKTFIIAEVGPNHQGSLRLAIKYIKKLSKIGVDAVKFQIGIAKEHYSINSFKPNYQIKKREKSFSIVSQAEKRLLKLNDHIRLYNECRKYKVHYMCSAFDLKSLRFLFQNTKFPYIKIASGEILSLDSLKFISNFNIPIILSTGMSTIQEIKKTIKILNKNKKKDITLLHCVSDYPTKISDLNLNFLKKLKKIFNYPVGLSDHSVSNMAPVIATSLGATIIEKHVTLNKKWKGPDHKASLTIQEFKKMVELIRETEKILGQEKKILTKEEKSNLKAVRKSCISTIDIYRGEKILKKHICFKRPGTGLSPMNYKKLINKKSKKFIKKDSLLYLKDFH